MPRKILFLGFLSTFYVAVFLILLNKYNWFPLEWWDFKGVRSFGDSWVVLEMVRCLYSEVPKESCEQFIYGPFLAFFIKISGLLLVDFNYLIIIMFVIFVSSLSVLFFQRMQKNQRFLSLLALSSPPALLLYERANIDLFIFSITIFAIFTFKKFHGYVSIFLLGFLVLIKFYTWPVFILLFLVEQRRKTRIAIVLLAVVLMLYIATILLLPQTEANYEAGSPFAAFGLKVIGESIGYFFLGFNPLYLHITLLLTLLLILIRFNIFSLLLRYKHIELNNSQLIGYSFLIIFLSMYFFNVNYDYRLIYLVPCLFVSGEITKRFGICFIGVFFLSINVGGIQVFGDVLLFLLVYDLTVDFCLKFKRRELI